MNYKHVLGMVALLIVGYYIGTKYPSLLKSVTG